MKDIEQIKERIQRIHGKEVLNQVLKKVKEMVRSEDKPQEEDLLAALDQVLLEQHMPANNSADILDFDNDLVVF